MFLYLFTVIGHFITRMPSFVRTAWMAFFVASMNGNKAQLVKWIAWSTLQQG